MKPKRKNRTRLSLDIDHATKKTIRKLAKRWEVSMTDAVRIAARFTLDRTA